MNSADFNKIMNEIDFPNSFIKKGRLAYNLIEHRTGAKLLVGFYLDSSIEKDSYFVQYFVQCLFIPFTTFNFSLGDRIGRYLINEDVKILNNDLKYFTRFDSLNTFDNFILYLENNTYYGHKIGRELYFSLTYFIDNNFEKSLQYLDEIIKFKSHSNSEWFKEDVLIAEFIKSCIEEDNYQKGIEQILIWQNATIKSLKISEK